VAETSPEVADRVSSARRAALTAAVVVGVALRWWDLGGPSPTFDESFTGVYAHLPLGRIAEALRLHDSHPPFDYLLRHPFATGGNLFWLRVPSALLATATLVVTLWWLGRRGWFGVGAVALVAISPFQVLYAHQARMYALMMLAGTVAALAAERWLLEARPRWRWVMAVALGVAVFGHAGGLLLAVGLLVVPGLRRDREAWWWRLAAVAVVGLWAVAWGPAFLDQARHDPASWIPLSSVRSVLDSLNGMTSFYTATGLLVVLVAVAGGVVLVRRHGALGRVWLALFVVPFGLVVLLGVSQHVLLPRTLAVGAWALPVAFAAVIDAVARRWVPAGVVAAALVLVLVAPSLSTAVSYEEGSAPALAELGAVVVPGDAVAVHPPWLAPLVQWRLGLPADAAAPAPLEGLDAYVAVTPGESFAGRVWVLQPDTYALDVGGLTPCPTQPTAMGGDYLLACYFVP